MRHLRVHEARPNDEDADAAVDEGQLQPARERVDRGLRRAVDEVRRTGTDIFGATDPNTGRPRKMEFGPYMMSAFRVLAALKGLRGTWLDIFARNPERKLEVKMIGDYEKLMADIATRLTPANHATAVSLAELPMDVKGYGYIKDGNYKQAKAKEAVLLRRLHMTDAERRVPVTEAAE